MAISQAAKVNEIDIVIRSGYDFKEGCTIEECTKLIQHYLNKDIKYIPNTKRIKLRTFVEKFNKKQIIVSFSEHIAYFNKGIFYDDFMYLAFKYNIKEDISHLKEIEGWWIIK